MSSAAESTNGAARSIIYLGMDVHKESITIAVLPEAAKAPAVQCKHDKRDAADLARFYRAGELTTVRIPSQSDERVRDVVRCRETFQKEILKSRHLYPEVPRPP